MNMPAGLRRVATVAALAAMLGGCRLSPDGLPAATMPQADPLQAIQNNVTPKVRWDVSLGGSADYAFTPALMGDVVWAAGRDGQVVGWMSTLAGKWVGGHPSAAVGRHWRQERRAVRGHHRRRAGVARRKRQDSLAQPLDQPSAGSPQSDGQRVLVRTNDGRLSAFDADSGKSLWTFQRPQPTLTVRNYGSTTWWAAKPCCWACRAAVWR